ncbi:MAG TPA: SulP family inorganic anion transporter [Acidimicrobiia bacterium]
MRFVLGGILPYQRRWLRPDVIAGVSAGAVVIPQAMGYATVAGLPVEIGLYTCIFPLAVYALVGGARRLSFSTTSTIVALTGLGLSTVGAVDGPEAMDAVSTLTVMVGLCLLFFRLIRLGWMIETVSEAVIDGLKVAVGLTIIADQLPKLLGIESAEGGFLTDVGNTLDQLGSINVPTLVISLVTIVGLLALKRWAPRVPGPLLAVTGGILLVVLTSVTESGVAVIPELPRGLPLPALPSFGYASDLLPFALAIAFMAYFESITAGRIARRPGDPRLDNDHEYTAVGVATIVGGLFQTVPPAGGFSQTQVNVEAGARTQVSQLVTAGLAVLVALFLAPVLADLPEATLGAIVTVSVLGLISFGALARLGRIDPLELTIAIVTGVIALMTNLLVGVLVGVLLTFYFVLRALNHPVVSELRRTPEGEFSPVRAGDPPIEGMLILRIEGGLYTMNIRRVQDEVYRRFEEAEPKPEVVVIDVGATVDTTVTVVDIFLEMEEHLAANGSALWVASLPPRALEKVRRVEVYEEWVRAGRIHPTLSAAVEAHSGRRRSR